MRLLISFNDLENNHLAVGVEIFDTDQPEECGDCFPEARYIQVPKGLNADEVVEFILANHQPGLFTAISEYTVGDWINCCSGKISQSKSAPDHPVALGLQRLKYPDNFSMFVGGKGCKTSIAWLRQIYNGRADLN